MRIHHLIDGKAVDSRGSFETVNPAIPSTLDAAALCKMADRGQIKGGMLDGPLAFDNAISAHAAQVKGIVSQVAGDADILAGHKARVVQVDGVTLNIKGE